MLAQTPHDIVPREPAHNAGGAAKEKPPEGYEEKPPEGYVYADGRITRKQAPQRPKKKKDIAQAREKRGLVMILLGNCHETEAWGDPCKNIAAAMPVLPQQAHPHHDK